MAHEAVDITVSVVSHGQMGMVLQLLSDLAAACRDTNLEVLLTLNLPEEKLPEMPELGYSLRVLRNSASQGFASNHNSAFECAKGKYFCVVNPDIRIQENPFPALLDCLSNARIGVSAPLVWSPGGELEDSFRRFPTPWSIFCKALGYGRGPDYEVTGAVLSPDWAGGMFLLFPETVFRQIHGFDTRYFLYYEDVDICARLRWAGYGVCVSPSANVVHAAQRASHARWQYRFWHLKSMARFFLSPAFFRQLWRTRDYSNRGGRS